MFKFIKKHYFYIFALHLFIHIKRNTLHIVSAYIYSEKEKKNDESRKNNAKFMRKVFDIVDVKVRLFV